MLKYNLSKLFVSWAIPNVPVFLVKNGFKKHIAYRIAKEEFTFLPLNQMEKLCYIFNCTPNDLMEWQPDKPEQLNEDIPLKKLLNPGSQNNIMNIVKGVPYDKLAEFAKKMEEVKKSL